VYTAKGFAGLLDAVGTGLIDPAEPVVFVHTGGLPALFAYADSLRPQEGA
jgi:1-aminocyclopropane-1-carboxylate deaminase/D-cysteine desulfhydrase-like pyridoxal-dependent ACC family enzyme